MRWTLWLLVGIPLLALFYLGVAWIVKEFFKK
jgi:hypothetical protein